MDREKAEREQVALEEATATEYDAELEAAGGTVIGRGRRVLVWSDRLKMHVWWRLANCRWDPVGVDRATARKLRVEVSDGHEGRSVEEVLAERWEAGAE